MNRIIRYRLLAAIKRRPGNRKLAGLLVLLALGGCATGSLDCVDLRQGACKVSFQRFLTDTSASFTGPDGLGFTYSSSPNQLALEKMAATADKLATVLTRIPLAAAEP